MWNKITNLQYAIAWKCLDNYGYWVERQHNEEYLLVSLQFEIRAWKIFAEITYGIWKIMTYNSRKKDSQQ